MMVFTKVIRSPVKRVMTNPPTPLGMAVGLAHKGVDTDTDGTDECRLSEVRAESRPEVVVDRIAARIDRARVNRRPMTKEVEEQDQQHQPSQDEQGKQAEPDLFHWIPLRVEEVERPLAVAWGWLHGRSCGVRLTGTR